MFEIIILFIIMGVIGNILKAAGNKGRQQQQPQTGQTTRPKPVDIRELFKEVIQDSSEHETGRQPRISFPVQEEPDEGSFGTAASEDEGHTGYTRSGNYSLREGSISEPLQVLSLDEDEKAARRLNFTADSVLTGIIFSEILSPPKARRRS